MSQNKSERKRPFYPQIEEETAKRNIYISGDAVSGALILKPSFSRLQKSSSICTPGYGDAPEVGDTLIKMSAAGKQAFVCLDKKEGYFFFFCLAGTDAPHRTSWRSLHPNDLCSDF